MVNLEVKLGGAVVETVYLKVEYGKCRLKAVFKKKNPSTGVE